MASEAAATPPSTRIQRRRSRLGCSRGHTANARRRARSQHPHRSSHRVAQVATHSTCGRSGTSTARTLITGLCWCPLHARGREATARLQTPPSAYLLPRSGRRRLSAARRALQHSPTRRRRCCCGRRRARTHSHTLLSSRPHRRFSARQVPLYASQASPSRVGRRRQNLKSLASPSPTTRLVIHDGSARLHRRRSRRHHQTRGTRSAHRTRHQRQPGPWSKHRHQLPRHPGPRRFAQAVDRCQNLRR